MYIHRSITYPPFNIGSALIEAIPMHESKGYARGEPIGYTEEEKEQLKSDTKEVGTLYITVV